MAGKIGGLLGRERALGGRRAESLEDTAEAGWAVQSKGNRTM